MTGREKTRQLKLDSGLILERDHLPPYFGRFTVCHLLVVAARALLYFLESIGTWNSVSCKKALGLIGGRPPIEHTGVAFGVRFSSMPNTPLVVFSCHVDQGWPPTTHALFGC